MTDTTATDLRHFDEASDEVARKLIGCLSKAKDSAVTPAEAEAALAAAQRLALKHRIDLSTVSLENSGLDSRSEEEMIQESLKTGKGYRRPPASKYLVSILVRYFNVEIVQGSGRWASEISFLGRSSDVLFAKYAYEYLHRAFGRAWVAYKRKYDAPMSHRNSFYVGVYQGICNVLEAAKTQDEKQLLLEAASAAAKEVSEVSNSYQLVVVSEQEKRRKFVDGLHPILRRKSWDWGNLESGTAMEEGREAGEKIKINKALPEKGQRNQPKPVAGALS